MWVTSCQDVKKTEGGLHSWLLHQVMVVMVVL